ncbi:4-(cytidine 5'-diphospho)-2-C-methyl-D-erythritol kinase [Nocardioides jiangxiensis]|uniref:4-diphosphocytidyl-2-C-methyl-D-erythritol kinase n=1 Tax=Nocardioides jiangxiensis TaxID=3064524 RepID=A0ABT9B3D9_9ACTN|nr:4-(cytidine 5'-diphospho)-2-C-methyl-D-erythritol kinase [Nocardioides sp. WY-20]MDO7867678.1 4-(cytidine 5'-diphospho)-2-C-methyl-D-erythritol kinase [Nocardioides sp. WY-20]
MTDRVTVRAPAKINLHLGVGGPRDDGFHPLETVYTSVGLYDDVVATPATAWSLSLDAAAYVDADGVPLDDSNIVAAAARALADLHGRDVVAAVRIVKGIPVAGGLAGGSADAAAALVALDRLLDLQTSDDDLLRIAADLGSDVPFALHGGHALGTGRGEVVEPLPAGDAVLWWVVVPSTSGGLSTPAVYRHYDGLAPAASPVPAPATAVVEALAAGDVHALAEALHNDLQAPAVDLRPDLGELIALGEASGALRGLVSGSGPTVVFLCAGPDEARALAGVLQEDGRSALVANGPVAGAHVVHGI